MDQRGTTPLLAAYKNGHFEVVEWLLKHVAHLPSDPECNKALLAPMPNDTDLAPQRTKCIELIMKVRNGTDALARIRNFIISSSSCCCCCVAVIIGIWIDNVTQLLLLWHIMKIMLIMCKQLVKTWLLAVFQIEECEVGVIVFVCYLLVLGKEHSGAEGSGQCQDLVQGAGC